MQTFWNKFPWKENFVHWLKFYLSFGPKGPIDSKSTLVQEMPCHRTGDKPLPEPVLSEFYDALVWLQGPVSLYKFYKN